VAENTKSQGSGWVFGLLFQSVGKAFLARPDGKMKKKPVLSVLYMKFAILSINIIEKYILTNLL
jgi:hypothetical protein